MDKASLIKLGLIAANANPAAPTAYEWNGEQFSSEQASEALRTALNEIAGSYSLFRENKNTVFSLIEETIDDVLPKKVMEQFSACAEVKQFAQGDKAVFVQKITNAARRRAKQFVTKVGLAGRYEVFKLDGRVDFAVLTSIIVEAMDEFILKEIQKALIACIADLPAANKHAATSFDEVAFDRLLAVARAYGDATVYCTYEFAAQMIPHDTSGTNWSAFSDKMKDQLWETGRLASYKNCTVVIWDQSFEDEQNNKRVIDPSYAFIIPSGAKKPVKIAFEGQTAVREAENEDWSRELQTYKKFGVATLVSNDICVYRNTALCPSPLGSAYNEFGGNTGTF